MHYRDPKYIIPNTYFHGPETEVQYFERMVREEKEMRKAQARQQRIERMMSWLEETGRKLRYTASPLDLKHA